MMFSWPIFLLMSDFKIELACYLPLELLLVEGFKRKYFGFEVSWDQKVII
jgi:hypothetical protein